MQAITGQLHEVTSASISNKTVLKATFDSAINNWQHLLLSAKGNLMQLEQYLATSRELRQYQRQIKDRLKLCRLSRIDFEVLHYLHQGFTQPTWAYCRWGDSEQVADHALNAMLRGIESNGI